MGLPLLNGFIGEFMILQGAFAANRVWAYWAVSGVVLGRRLPALALPAGLLGQDHERGEPAPAGPQRARAGHARAARGALLLDRHLPEAGPGFLHAPVAQFAAIVQPAKFGSARRAAWPRSLGLPSTSRRRSRSPRGAEAGRDPQTPPSHASYPEPALTTHAASPGWPACGTGSRHWLAAFAAAPRVAPSVDRRVARCCPGSCSCCSSLPGLSAFPADLLRGRLDGAAARARVQAALPRPRRPDRSRRGCSSCSARC